MTGLAKHSVLGGVLGLLLGLTACGSSGGTSSNQSSSTQKAPLASLVPQKIRAAGVIETATTAFAPAQFIKPGSTTWDGFNIDLMNAMVAKLGVGVHFVNVPFEQLILGTQSGRYDTSIAAQTDNPQREQQVDFMDFTVAGTVFVVAPGNPKKFSSGADTGCGTKIAELTGSDDNTLIKMMADACKAHKQPAPQSVAVATAGDKQLALASGRVDAFFWADISVPTLEGALGGTIETVPVMFQPKVFLGMIFNKDNHQLRDAFLKAMQALHQDGGYSKILAKWKVSAATLSTPGINLATKSP